MEITANTTDTDKEVDNDIAAFIDNLKQGRLSGSYDVAKRTVLLLKKLVSERQWTDAKTLMDIIRKDGQRLINAQPTEAAVGNMVRKVLKIVREEQAGHQETEHQESLQKLLGGQKENANETQQEVSKLGLKEAVIDSIGELLVELETSAYNIAEQAPDYIHANEVIMTYGKSKTVQAFLKKAAKKIKFQVIVAEHTPYYDGHEMAASLAKDGITTTVITDAAVFAVMARVNKVIIGTHTVMANGGLKAISGSHALALAAKHYSTPLIVCAAMFKLSPQYLCSYNQDAFNVFTSPHDVMNYSEGEILSHVQMHNPVFDYVPPELVTSFISNTGGKAPSYIYRSLTELYHPEDYNM